MTVIMGKQVLEFSGWAQAAHSSFAARLLCCGSRRSCCAAAESHVERSVSTRINPMAQTRKVPRLEGAGVVVVGLLARAWVPSAGRQGDE